MQENQKQEATRILGRILGREISEEESKSVSAGLAGTGRYLVVSGNCDGTGCDFDYANEDTRG